jgi:outer membrane protein assembly factor BamE
LSAKTISAALILVILTGCSMPKFSLPRLFKITVQQGNVLTQDMVDQLKPGMSHSQVAFIMGEPILRNTFNENRWDYIYTIELPGYFSQDVRMSLFFEGDVLAYFTGDLAPSEDADADATDEDDTSESPVETDLQQDTDLQEDILEDTEAEAEAEAETEPDAKFIWPI